MKIVIALACLLAIATALEETKKVDVVVDLEAAEQNRPGGSGHRTGYGGAQGGQSGAGYHDRRGRSVEDEALSSDLEAAEGHRRGWGPWGHRGGNYGGRHGGYRYGSYPSL